MNNLDDIKLIKAIDILDMFTLLCEFPSQCKQAVAIADNFNLPSGYGNFSNVVFSGLGGSAVGGNILESYLIDEIKMPIFVNRNYTLPKFVGENTLIFVLSYSGNTEETLSAYDQAKEKKAKIIVISSGGKLVNLVQKDGFPLITIPSGLPPRCALGYLFFPPLIILSKMEVIENKQQQIGEMILVLDNLRETQLKPDIKGKKNPAKKIAQDILGRFPVIYGSCDHLEGVLMRWRSQLAENGKTLSSSHLFPEMNHNEIVGWENPREILDRFSVILLQDKDDYPRTKKRMEITKSIIGEQNIPLIEVDSQGEGLLSRIFSLVYIGDFASFYLAILNNVDPTPVDKITYLKGELVKE